MMAGGAKGREQKIGLRAILAVQAVEMGERVARPSGRNERADADRGDAGIGGKALEGEIREIGDGGIVPGGLEQVERVAQERIGSGAGQAGGPRLGFGGPHRRSATRGGVAPPGRGSTAPDLFGRDRPAHQVGCSFEIAQLEGLQGQCHRLAHGLKPLRLRVRRRRAVLPFVHRNPQSLSASPNGRPPEGMLSKTGFIFVPMGSTMPPRASCDRGARPRECPRRNLREAGAGRNGLKLMP